MSKYNKKIRDLCREDNLPDPEVVAATAQAALDPGSSPEVVIASLRGLGHGALFDFVAGKRARVSIRPASDTLALAQVHEGIGAGFFDEADELKSQNDYRIGSAPTANIFGKLLRQYAPSAVVLVRPSTPYFPSGVWLPGPPKTGDVGPSFDRPGCFALRVTGVLIGGGWVWVRPRPEGGISSIRFPFHRAAIETVRAVPGAVYSRTSREWMMQDGSDASRLLADLRDVFPMEHMPVRGA